MTAPQQLVHALSGDSGMECCPNVVVASIWEVNQWLKNPSLSPVTHSPDSRQFRAKEKEGGGGGEETN